MSIHTETCYWAECDICGGTRAGGDVDILHFPTSGDAVGHATDYDWCMDGDFLWCDDCEDLGKVICVCGGRFYMHDHGEGPCDNTHMATFEGCECPKWRLVVVADTVEEVARVAHASHARST